MNYWWQQESPNRSQSWIFRLDLKGTFVFRCLHFICEWNNKTHHLILWKVHPLPLASQGFPRLPPASPTTDTWCYRVTNRSCSLSPAGNHPLGESSALSVVMSGALHVNHSDEWEHFHCRSTCRRNCALFVYVCRDRYCRPHAPLHRRQWQLCSGQLFLKSRRRSCFVPRRWFRDH